VLGRILNEYPHMVRLVFKDFPLDSHPLARPAHEAARCAGEAGKYWEYHDRLFEAQPRFAREDLIRYASELRLPRDGFVACLDSGRFHALVEGDIQEGRQLGIRNTPTFIINGRGVVGAAPYEKFKALIDQALKERGRP
jgi:protein-disulfide isomerase